MILYLLIIAIAILIIGSVVALVSSASFGGALGFSALAAVGAICISGLTATVCRLLPKKCADHNKKIFQVSAKEKKFYEKIKIRKWKDKVPEIGQFTGFRKNKIADPKSVEYLERFLMEISYGEMGHFFSALAGFLLLLLFPIYEYWLAVAIPVACVNALLNLPSLFILRYNSYKMRILYNSVVKKQARTA